MAPKATTVIYHLVRADYWNGLEPNAPYLPQDFESDGFIHCTQGHEKLIQVANGYYRDVPGDFLLLVIDEDQISAPVKYEGGFPHVYGPLNREAIVVVCSVTRHADGRFEWPGDFD